MTKPRYEICADQHRATGTIGWPVPYPEGYTGVHASTQICERTECQQSANRWVRGITGHDGVYRSFAESRAARAASTAVITR